MVRLLHLRYRRRTRLPAHLLPGQLGPDGHAALLRHLLGGLPRPPARRHPRWALRRQDRAQARRRLLHLRHGNRDVRHRPPADRRDDRCRGADPPRAPALRAGPRGGWSVGRHHPAAHRIRRPEEARLRGNLRADGCADRRHPGQPRLPHGLALRLGQGLPRLGLAHPVPPQRRAVPAGPVHPQAGRGLGRVQGAPGARSQARCSGRQAGTGVRGGQEGLEAHPARLPHDGRHERDVLRRHRRFVELCLQRPGHVA